MQSLFNELRKRIEFEQSCGAENVLEEKCLDYILYFMECENLVLNIYQAVVRVYCGNEVDEGTEYGGL